MKKRKNNKIIFGIILAVLLAAIVLTAGVSAANNQDSGGSNGGSDNSNSAQNSNSNPHIDKYTIAKAILSSQGLKLNFNVDIGSFTSSLVCGCESQGNNACPDWTSGIRSVICANPGQNDPGYQAFVNVLKNPVQNACFAFSDGYKRSLGLDFSPIDTNGINVSFTSGPIVAYIEGAKVATDSGDYVYYFSFHFKPEANYSSDNVAFLLRRGSDYVDVSNANMYGRIRKVTPSTDGGFTYSFSMRSSDAITESCMKFSGRPKGMTTDKLCAKVADVSIRQG